MWADAAEERVEVVTVDEALKYFFDRACAQPWPHAELVEIIGARLEARGELSARTVAAICREYGRRQR